MCVDFNSLKVAFVALTITLGKAGTTLETLLKLVNMFGNPIYSIIIAQYNYNLLFYF